MPAKQIAMPGREEWIAGARLRRLDDLHLIEPDAVEDRERRGDIAGALVDRIAARPVPELALGRHAIREAGRELRRQPLLARAKPLAVAGERRMRDAAIHRRRTTREQHEPRLVAVIAIQRAMATAGARPQRIGRLRRPRAAPEPQLIQAIHLHLRDVRLTSAGRRHRARVAAHLRAERAVVELLRDCIRRELGHALV